MYENLLIKIVLYFFHFDRGVCGFKNAVINHFTAFEQLKTTSHLHEIIGVIIRFVKIKKLK